VAPPTDMETGEEEETSTFELNQFRAESHAKLVQLRKEVRINCDLKVVLATGPELRARCAAGLREQPYPQFGGSDSDSLLGVNQAGILNTADDDASESGGDLLSAFGRQMKETNELVREHSAQAKLVLLVRPPLPVDANAAPQYMAGVGALLDGLPPTILLAAGRRQNVIPQEL
jgi:hypothetical protein